MSKFVDSLILLLAMIAVTLFFGALIGVSLERQQSVIILVTGYIGVMACFITGFYQTITE